MPIPRARLLLHRRSVLARRRERAHRARASVVGATNIDEPVTPDQLDRWITARRIRTMGWRHDGTLVQARVNEHSQPLYSLKRARKLRRRDERLQRIRQQVKAHQN